MSRGPLDPIELLQRLVAARSYSGQEGPAADVLCDALAATGFQPRRLGDSVICERGHGDRALLLNSHLDTVPASNRWTRDPWTPVIEDDRLYGLGSTDAKSCVAAMAAAFTAIPDPGDRGRLILTATTEEETGGGDHPNGMQATLPTLGPLAGAIVGEPTRLNICNGQRGMVRAVLRVAGRAGHASRPWEGENAIEKAAEVILAVRQLAADVAESSRDEAIGITTIQPTLMQAGTAKNVIPDSAAITLDIRTTRRCDNAAIIARLRETAAAEVEIISERFQPVATDAGAGVIRAAQAALPDAEITAFGGVSDLFFLTSADGGPVPCCLIGPGDGRQSHQPDEFVSVGMVRRAAAAYADIATRFWEVT